MLFKKYYMTYRKRIRKYDFNNTAAKQPRRSYRAHKAKLQKALLFALIAGMCCLFLFSTYMLLSTLIEQNKSAQFYADLSDSAVASSVGTNEPNLKSPEVSQNGNTEPAKPIEVNFEELAQVNQDIVGWLYSENTVVNYPIVRGNDNAYYINHLFDGKRSSSGTLFMDYRNDSDFSDENSIIYGHNMNDGSMFSALIGYKSQEYYDEHPVMYLLTPQYNYRIEIFSAYICASDAAAYTRQFASKTDYSKHLSRIIRKSNFESSVQVSANDRIATLSTCTYEYDNVRYVVHGKLVSLD